jgi:VanZ family protein
VRNKFLLATGVWTVFITYMCLVSASSVPEAAWLNIRNKDKIVHFIFYLVFTLLLYKDYKVKTGSIKKAFVYAFATAVSYGIIIEICQGLFTDGRNADSMDVLANTSGSAFAILMLWLRQKRKK